MKYANFQLLPISYLFKQLKFVIFIRRSLFECHLNASKQIYCSDKMSYVFLVKNNCRHPGIPKKTKNKCACQLCVYMFCNIDGANVLFVYQRNFQQQNTYYICRLELKFISAIARTNHPTRHPDESV